MFFSEFSAYINSHNASVQIFRVTESFYVPEERWNCIITLESSDTSLKCKGRGETLEVACVAALDKFSAHMANQSLSKALAPAALPAPSNVVPF